MPDKLTQDRRVGCAHRKKEKKNSVQRKQPCFAFPEEYLHLKENNLLGNMYSRVKLQNKIFNGDSI